MKTTISRDNLIEGIFESSKFEIFKDDEAEIQHRFVITAGHFGERSTVRLSPNELKVVYQFCKKTFNYK